MLCAVNLTFYLTLPYTVISYFGKGSHIRYHSSNRTTGYSSCGKLCVLLHHRCSPGSDPGYKGGA